MWLLLALASPWWVTFDVLNPQVVGDHKILHLEDIIGPKRRGDIAQLPQPSVVVIFSVAPEQCPPTPGALCEDVRRTLAASLSKGALLVAVLAAERVDAAQFLYPFVVARDVRGLARQGLSLDRPGTFVVVDSKGEVTRLPSVATNRWQRRLEELKVMVESAIQKDQEEQE